MAVLETLTWGGTNVANTRRYWLANVTPSTTSRKNFIDVITSGAVNVGETSNANQYFTITNNVLTPCLSSDTGATKIAFIVLDVTASYVDVHTNSTVTTFTGIKSKKGTHAMEKLTDSNALATEIANYYPNRDLLPVCWQQWFKNIGSFVGCTYRISLSAS